MKLLPRFTIMLCLFGSFAYNAINSIYTNNLLIFSGFITWSLTTNFLSGEEQTRNLNCFEIRDRRNLEKLCTLRQRVTVPSSILPSWFMDLLAETVKKYLATSGNPFIRTGEGNILFNELMLDSKAL